MAPEDAGEDGDCILDQESKHSHTCEAVDDSQLLDGYKRLAQYEARPGEEAPQGT